MMKLITSILANMSLEIEFLRLRYSLKLMMMMKHFNNRYIDDELLTTMITNTRKKMLFVNVDN